MSVVLRCPTCGTTQGDVGECEACSEGEVRYFCTNHDEGIWLDSPVCSRCAAKFGDPARKPRAPVGPSRPAGAPDFRPPRRPPAPERPSEPDFGGRPPRRAEFEEPVEPETLPRTKSLAELLEEIVEERTRAGGREEAGKVLWPEPRARRPGFPVAGCLGRIAAVVFLLITVVVIFLLLLFGSFFSG